MATRDELEKSLTARYTPEYTQEVASRRHATYAALPKIQTWKGAFFTVDNGQVLHLVADYERAQFAPDEASMFAACDAAISRLVGRLEMGLHGNPSRKTLEDLWVPGGVTPGKVWGGEITIGFYSRGPMPVLRVVPGQGAISEATTGVAPRKSPIHPKHWRPNGMGHVHPSKWTKPPPVEPPPAGWLECRFAYYGNTGPVL